MVDLKPAEALVGDPEAAEDTTAVAGPDMLAHDRRDRIPRCEDPRPPATRIAPRHRRTRVVVVRAQAAEAVFVARRIGSPMTFIAAS